MVMEDVRAPLVGRAAERRVLRSAIEACARSRSTVLEITGDPGMGKTRLLAELGELAAAAGLTVLSGRASEFERESSFGAFAEPVRRCLELRTEPDSTAYDEELAALRDLVLPGCPDADSGRRRPPGVERHRLHRAVGRLLSGAGRERGLLLCLDDLHWADDGSLELLHFLLRQPPRTPLVLACAHRPRQSSGKLSAYILDADAYRVVRVPLAPLDRRSCEMLLGDRHTPERREQICAGSGGNPLWIEVLCELAQDEALAAEGFADPPDTLRAALAREIAPLNEPELAVLRAAAVLGDPFDPLLLGPIAGLEAGATLDALDGLAARDLVRRPASRDGARTMLQFRHPLLREVVSHAAPPGWWIAANARADATLRCNGAGPVERAPFIARSAQAGDQEAVGVLIDAAGSTLNSAPATAAAWLRTALRLSASDTSDDARRRRFEALVTLARASGMTGDLPGCRDALARALDLVPPDRPDQRVTVVTLGSVIERILGSGRAAERVLDDELARLPRTDPIANPIRLQLATLGMARGDLTGASRHLNTLITCAEAPLNPRTRTAVAACRALGAAYSGRTDALRVYATEAASSLDALDDAEIATLLDEVGQLGWAEALGEQYGDAVRHMERAVAIAQETGQTYILPYLLLCQAYAQQAAGDLAGGSTSATSAEEIAHLLDRPDLIGYAMTLRAAATVLREGPEVAAPTAERALRTIRRRGRLRELSVALLASVRLDQGRPGECVELVRDITGTDRSPTTHSLRATWYAIAARAEIARGEHTAARDWATRAAEAAQATGLPGQRGHAELALSCLPHDDPSERIELLASAAGRVATAGLVLAEARAGLFLGQALTAAGRLDEADAAVGHAKKLADNHGALHLSALAIGAQRRIGARRPRSGADTRRALSEQEARVSQLVVRGLSNRDIAASMFISVKTVEAHLTRVFRKLDVTSRTALISALDRAGY
jgi:DNA-binding CsgD family transcriptional regulator